MKYFHYDDLISIAKIEEREITTMMKDQNEVMTVDGLTVDSIQMVC